MKEANPQGANLPELDAKTILDSLSVSVESRDGEIDFESTVIEAEDIAIFQVQLEEKLIKDNIPEDQWLSVTSSYIDQNPNLKKYRQLLEAYVFRHVCYKRQIDLIWNEAVGDISEGRQRNKVLEVGESVDAGENEDESKNESASTVPISTTPVSVSDEIINKSNFESGGMDEALAVAHRLGINLDGVHSAKVIKGRRSFVFYLDKEKFLDLHKDESETPESIAGTAAIYKYRVPVLFMIEGGKNNAINFRHEIQHIQNSLLVDFAKDTKRTLKNDFSHPFYESAERKLNDDIIVRHIEDELLASVSALSVLTPKDEVQVKEINEFLGSLCDGLKSEYINDYVKFYKPQGLIKQDRSFYEKLVEDSMPLLIELLNVYFPVYKKHAVDMTINTLQQFSIEKWPAVVRLIKSKRSK